MPTKVSRTLWLALIALFSIVAIQLLRYAPVQGQTAAALSNASTWQNTPTYDGSGQVVHPDIVYFPNGWNGYRYWLVLEPYPYSQDSYENPSILVSNDGASWAPPPGISNPVARANTSYLADADLLYDQASDQLWMYYPHQTVNGQTLMVRKTSSDGINWGDPYDEPVVFSKPDYQVLSPAVVKVGSTYKMWSVNTGVEWLRQPGQHRGTAHVEQWHQLVLSDHREPRYPGHKFLAHRRHLCTFQVAVLGADSRLPTWWQLREDGSLLRHQHRRHQLDDV